MLFRAIKHQVDKGPVDAVTSKAKYTLNDNRLLREDLEYKTLVIEPFLRFESPAVEELSSEPLLPLVSADAERSGAGCGAQREPALAHQSSGLRHHYAGEGEAPGPGLQGHILLSQAPQRLLGPG